MITRGSHLSLWDPRPPTPQVPEKLEAAIEEQADPHAHADKSLGADDDAGAEKLDDADMVKLDRRIQLTVKDFKQFGWTENCPRRLDLQAGAYCTDRHHTGNSRLRMYLVLESQHRKVASSKTPH